MANALTDSYQLLLTSSKLLLTNKRLLVFPLVALLCCIVLIMASGIPAINTYRAAPALNAAGEPNLLLWPWILYAFGIYFLCSVITLGARVATIACTHELNTTGNMTLAKGIDAIVDNLGTLFLWALIDASVGAVIRMLERTRAFNGLFALLLGASWTLVSFLSLPLMILNQHPPLAAIKESVTLLKSTWGQQILGLAGITLVFYCFYLPAYLLTAASFFWLYGHTLFVGLAIAALLVLLGMLVDSSLHGIYQTLLLHDAKASEGA